MFDENQKKKLQKHIPIIAGITNLTGTVISALIFENKDVAEVAGKIVHQSTVEILSRIWSPRQEARILAASVQAIDYIDKLIKQGKELRQDGFFDEGTVARSDATEVVDSMLFTVGNEVQEKKIRYMAHLIKNAAFDESISADSACYFLQVFRNLTYRQICMIKLIVCKDRYQLSDKSKINMTELGIRDPDVNNLEQFFEQYEDTQILHEFLDLHVKGHIILQMSHNTSMIFKTMSMIPNSARSGQVLFKVYRHMNLDIISDDDLAPIVKALS